VTLDLRASLQRAVRGPVTVDPADLARLGRDESHLPGAAGAAVRPVDAEDVVELVRWARRHRVPLVARGAGTSLDGESTALHGGVVVDLSHWAIIHEVAVDERSVRVGPGVVNRVLQQALEPHGLFYPPNPGSWETCTIGGNVGTNASGPRSYRYGPTRRWVREVEAVLGTGERVRFGRRVEKRSVGPDMLQMFVGSEGTLGIATEITLRVAPLPPVRVGLVVPLPPAARLGRIAGALARTSDTGLSAVEYLDRYCAQGIVRHRAARWPAGSALLLMEVEASTASDARARERRIRAVLRRFGIRSEPWRFDDANALWSLRGESGRVLIEQAGPHIRGDVAVPVGTVDALVAALRGIARRERVPMYLFGHLGEGSLHPNFEVDPGSRAGERVRTAMGRAALDLGGTISGEHGVGWLGRGLLESEIGPTGVRILRALRLACDPDQILNPGKLYPGPLPATARSSRSPSGEEGGGARPRSPSGGRRPSKSASPGRRIRAG
jgi:FAD/FMN-containing dehydrogenase